MIFIMGLIWLISVVFLLLLIRYRLRTKVVNNLKKSFTNYQQVKWWLKNRKAWRNRRQSSDYNYIVKLTESKSMTSNWEKTSHRDGLVVQTPNWSSCHMAMFFSPTEVECETKQPSRLNTLIEMCVFFFLSFLFSPWLTTPIHNHKIPIFWYQLRRKPT